MILWDYRITLIKKNYHYSQDHIITMIKYIIFMMSKFKGMSMLKKYIKKSNKSLNQVNQGTDFFIKKIMVRTIYF